MGQQRSPLARSNQRGAALVEYALGASLIVVLTLAGVQVLTDGAGDAIQQTGTDIAEPREYASVLVTTTLPPPADWFGDGVPDGETLYDVMLQFDDVCLEQGRRTLELEECSGELDTLFSFEYTPAGDYLVTGSNTGDCIVADGRAGARLLHEPCSDIPEEYWETIQVAVGTVIVRNAANGNCWAINRDRWAVEEVCSGGSEQQIKLVEAPGP